jgi:hypothetical protein
MSFIALCVVAAQEVISAHFGVTGLKPKFAERRILRPAQNDTRWGGHPEHVKTPFMVPFGVAQGRLAHHERMSDITDQAFSRSP